MALWAKIIASDAGFGNHFSHRLLIDLLHSLAYGQFVRFSLSPSKAVGESSAPFWALFRQITLEDSQHSDNLHLPTP